MIFSVLLLIFGCSIFIVLLKNMVELVLLGEFENSLMLYGVLWFVCLVRLLSSVWFWSLLILKLLKVM